MTDHPAPADHPIVKSLLRLIRAEAGGAWDGEPDDLLLSPFIVTKQAKRELPLIGDPDPDVLARVEKFYTAIGGEIEHRTGKAITPILNIHHEGWGRIVLITGRLVAVTAHVRELHRFGFQDLGQLIEKAEKLVADGVAAIEKYPDVVDA